MAAEHKVLDLSICGKHTYSVTGCMAYGADGMKYDNFIFSALDANPVSFDELEKIIEARNAEIMAKDEAEERIGQIEKQMKELERQLAEAKAILEK
jgi:hypothetical protein